MGFSRWDFIDRGGDLVERLEFLTNDIENWIKSSDHIDSHGDGEIDMDAIMSDRFSDIFGVIERLQGLDTLLV